MTISQSSDVRTLRFDAAGTPCGADALQGALAHLERAQAGSGARALAAATVRAGAPLGGVDANLLHRYLLTQKKERCNKQHGLDRTIERSLVLVRPHSDLYGRRGCQCVRAAFVAFCTDVSKELAAYRDRDRDVWSISSPPDVSRTARGLDLATLVRVSAASLAQFNSHTPALIEARFSTDGNRIDIATRTRHQRAAEYAFTRLPADRARVTDMMTAPRRPVAPWVQGWPQPLVDLVLRRQRHRFAPGPRVEAFAAQLLDAGFASLDVTAQEAAGSLAAQWEGTAAELLATARTIAEPAVAQVT